MRQSNHRSLECSLTFWPIDAKPISIECAEPYTIHVGLFMYDMMYTMWSFFALKATPFCSANKNVNKLSEDMGLWMIVQY